MPGMNNWVFWSLLSAVFAGATAVLAKVGVQGIDSQVATAIRTTVILVFTWILAAHTRQFQRLDSIPPRSYLFLVLSGLATGASWICYFRALKIGEASLVAPIDKLSVVFVIAFAAIFLGESITWQSLAGGGLIVAGAILLAWK